MFLCPVGDVSISIVKGKSGESQDVAKAAKSASVDADDDDEQNELEGEVNRRFLFKDWPLPREDQFGVSYSLENERLIYSLRCAF